MWRTAAASRVSLASPAPRLTGGSRGSLSSICVQVMAVTLYTGDLNSGQRMSWEELLLLRLDGSFIPWLIGSIHLPPPLPRTDCFYTFLFFFFYSVKVKLSPLSFLIKTPNDDFPKIWCVVCRSPVCYYKLPTVFVKYGNWRKKINHYCNTNGEQWENVATLIMF